VRFAGRPLERLDRLHVRERGSIRARARDVARNGAEPRVAFAAESKRTALDLSER
jgi:hypothetical protein